MAGHYPNPSMEAQLAWVVANVFRDEGWKIVDQRRQGVNGLQKAARIV
jgi:hypothetical protein